MLEKLKRYLPEILAGLGVVGCGIVGISAAKAQRRVDNEIADRTIVKDERVVIEPDEKELRRLYMREYLPTAIIFALTSGCILGSNKLSKDRYDALIARYTGLGAGFAAYRSAVVKEYGTEVDDKLCEETVAVLQDPAYVDLLAHDVPGGKLWFKEPITGIMFEMYERDVLLAEYHLNRLFALEGGCASVGDLLYFLGIDGPNRGYKYGWTAEHGYYWIDISHLKHIGKHGEVYYELNYMFEPEIGYEDYIAEPGEEEYYQELSYVGNV